MRIQPERHGLQNGLGSGRREVSRDTVAAGEVASDSPADSLVGRRVKRDNLRYMAAPWLPP